MPQPSPEFDVTRTSPTPYPNIQPIKSIPARKDMLNPSPTWLASRFHSPLPDFQPIAKPLQVGGATSIFSNRQESSGE
ncbi:hypothetical protein DSO57_1038728 [Entomophthora muscae]|uniref:Uncharacterized protein n=1 Tax=Entomophthora muscae TaxID=34485 RepID=A0ACC2RDB2_9FUNG|nr:hypothetical protein DSO57_1038728 [Entomophthora muscae]